MPDVNPDILFWARTRAGLSEAEAAAKLDIRPAYGKTPEQRLDELERGRCEPSQPMLIKMADKYRQPLITFYLEQPPRPSDRSLEFRTLSGSRPRNKQALLETLVRDLLASQSIVHEILAEEEAPDVPFIGSLSTKQGVPYALTMVQELLDTKSPRNSRNVGQYFERLRDAVEGTRVFVLLKGDLGSYHTVLDTDTFRGLSLADSLAPFIIVNNNDAKAAWCFTLLHEFVHLLLGNKPCDGGHNSTKEVEQFCDDVASQFLLPEEPVREFRATHSDLSAAITNLAEDWKVSRALVAYRLLREGKIERPDYQRLVLEFRRAWLNEKQRQRERNREANDGPGYYILKRHRIGKAMLDFVGRSLSERSLPNSRAAVVLNVKPTQVQPMLDCSPKPK